MKAKELPKRKISRLKNYNYNTPGAYFITVCTENKEEILSEIRVGTGVLDRPLIQRNLRTVREAGPYEHRARLCKIKELDKPEFVDAFV